MQSSLARLGAIAGIASAFACAAVTANANSSSDAPPLPPPGRLVDIGGWHLHLNCTGEAGATQPTVILEAGLGDFSVEWSLVQPSVARFARVCSYDRAGDGWSELGPNPRTFRQIVYELHTLLEKAGERPPYVLVGHSYGGSLVRLYQSTYPSEVAGMVLVDAGADNPWRLLPDGNPPRDKLPLDAKRMRTWALGRLGHVAAAVNPFEHEELAALRADRATREYPLGDMPLVVITRGISEEEGPDGRAFEEERTKDHAAIAALSRSGKQMIAAKSGHHVQLDEPDLVVAAIQQVIAAARK